MTRQIFITEAAAQAAGLKAAAESSQGAAPAAEQHLQELCESKDVTPVWKRWSDGIIEAGRSLQ